MENNQCAVLIYLYCPHKYSITHQKLIVQLIVISTPGFTHTKKLHCIYHNSPTQKNYTVSTIILYYFDTNTTPYTLGICPPA